MIYWCANTDVINAPVGPPSVIALSTLPVLPGSAVEYHQDVKVHRLLDSWVRLLWNKNTAGRTFTCSLHQWRRSTLKSGVSLVRSLFPFPPPTHHLPLPALSVPSVPFLPWFISSTLLLSIRSLLPSHPGPPTRTCFPWYSTCLGEVSANLTKKFSTLRHKVSKLLAYEICPPPLCSLWHLRTDAQNKQRFTCIRATKISAYPLHHDPRQNDFLPKTILATALMQAIIKRNFNQPAVRYFCCFLRLPAWHNAMRS